MDVVGRATHPRGRRGIRLDADLRAIALAVVAGACLVYRMPVLPTLALFVPPLALCLLRFPGRTLVAAMLLSAVWTVWLANQHMAQRLPAAQDSSVRWVHGHIEGLVETAPIRSRFAFVTDAAPRRIRLSWYDDPPPLQPGDCFDLKVKLSAPHGSANPGGFDYEAWLWREGIGATGYVKQARPCPAAHGWSVGGVRAAAVAGIGAALGDHSMRGVIEALTLGVEDRISNAQWEVLRITGTSHMVAISGWHIALVATWLFFLTRWAALRLPGRVPALTIAAIVAFSGAYGYALLAGLALPTQRALVMLGVGLAALWSARRLSFARLLALAALAVVLWHPVAVMSPGFWLSFGAVAWIIYLVQFRPRGKIALFLWLQLGLSAGLVPVTLYAFSQASVVSPLVNAVLIPLAGVFVPILLLCTAATLIWPLVGGPLLYGCAQLLAGMWSWLEWVAAWPLAAVDQAVPGLLAVVLAIAGIALFFTPRGIPGRWLGAIFLVPLIIGWQPRAQAIPQGGYRLVVLDVGQGLAAVVHTRDHTLVFDAGPAYRTGFNAGGAIVAPYLRHARISHIDLMMISHPDMDHAGGAAQLAGLVPVKRRVGAGSNTPCRAGQHWRWDGVDFRVLHPMALPSGEFGDNNRSCVLRVSGPGGVTLLTGDIEAPAEAVLIARLGPALAADTVVVAHHGSDSSSTEAFVAASAPAYALISSGWNNRWGFPDATVVARFRSHGAHVLNTATAGAIFVDVWPSSDGIEVRGWRRMHRRFWQIPQPD